MSLLDAMLIESHRDKREVWIAKRTDQVKGSGTETDPFNGNTDQEEERFDALMRRLDQENLEYTAIHIGPGVFKTHGTGGVAQGVGWRMRKGWKLIGSGIDVTVL